MKLSLTTAGVALAALLIIAPALAQQDTRPDGDREGASFITAADEPPTPEDPPETSAGPAGPRSSEAPVVYKPPRRGSPRGRVAGATRGASALPAPLALAPDHVAHTLSASPSLFWHIDGVPPEDARIVFTWVESDGAEPLLEIDLALPKAPGIQRLDLAGHGVVLEPNIEYVWSISLLPDAHHAADDVVSSGHVQRVPAAALGAQLPTASAFAEAGLWYDALARLSDAIVADSANLELRAARNSLLRQAKLDAAVE